MRIPQTSFTWPVQINVSLWHWNGERGGRCSHGPCSENWPWWKQIAFLWCNITCNPKAPGRRLWIYTRWGAIPIDCTIDRRFRLTITKKLTAT